MLILISKTDLYLLGYIQITLLLDFQAYLFCVFLVIQSR